MNYEKKFKSTSPPNQDAVNERFKFREFCKKFKQIITTKTPEEINEDDYEMFKGVLSKDIAKDLKKYEQPDCREEIRSLVSKYLSGEVANGLKSNKFKGIEKSLDLFQSGLYLLGGDPNVGKMVTDVTPIPTPEGFKLNGELKTGDYVFGRNGKPTKITGVYPQGVLPIYRVKMVEGSYLDVGLDHLWYVETSLVDRKGNKRKGRVLKTSELISDLKRPDGRPKFCIPRTAPVEFEKRSLLIKPYTLGVLISEGGLTDKGVKFTNSDKELIDRVSLECEHPEYINGKGIEWRINNGNAEIGTREYLMHYGLFGKHSFEKFIPEEYLISDIKDRIDLLRGLMDGDGTINKNNLCCSYSTSSELLKNNVIQLVRSLGGRVSWSSRIGKYRKNGVYKETRINYLLHIKFCNNTNPFFISRKANVFKPLKKEMNYIESIEYIGDFPATCISVEAEDHLYLGGKDFVVTHNTYFMQNLFLDLLESDENTFGILISMDDPKPDVYTRLISISARGKLKTNDIKEPTRIATQHYNVRDEYGNETSIYGLDLFNESVENVMNLANDRFLIYDMNNVKDFDSLKYFLEKAIVRNADKKVFVMIDGLFNVDVDGSEGEDLRSVNMKRANLVKFFSDHYDILVMASVELRKRDARYGYKEPGMSDIMESGKFAYNAKLVIMLCFDNDQEIDDDVVYTKAKFVKNKISSFRGSKYLKFHRPSGFITENATKEQFDAQFKKNDENSFGGGFVKNKKQEK